MKNPHQHTFILFIRAEAHNAIPLICKYMCHPANLRKLTPPPPYTSPSLYAIKNIRRRESPIPFLLAVACGPRCSEVAACINPFSGALRYFVGSRGNKRVWVLFLMCVLSAYITCWQSSHHSTGMSSLLLRRTEKTSLLSRPVCID